MKDNLRITDNSKVKMTVREYAGQGNAILGIRDSGKSYTAMKAAEELLSNNIPIVVFDPVGIWRHLKTGVNGFKGFPVVVAGGNHGDLPLNVNNAPLLMRAAMKEGISIVFDLYSVELSVKRIWIRIVQECIDILMYENMSYGLRHIFLEEAAEFIPQRIQPQHNQVYSSCERLARMGRNMKLGYTLINQRAEEINKAIFEISACCFLHKQVGKNSLLSIQKWFDVKQTGDSKQIIKTLPTLSQGECWMVGEREPIRIKINEKKTFHPTPSKQEDISNHKPADVSIFIQQITKALAPAEKSKPQNVVFKSDPVNFEEIINNKNKEIKTLNVELSFKNNEINKLVTLLKKVNDLSSITIPLIEVQFNREKIPVAPVSIKSITASQTNSILGRCELSILKFLFFRRGRSFSKEQIGAMTGYSPGSGGFNNAISKLFSSGLINRESGKISSMTQYEENILSLINTPENMSLEVWLTKLGKCSREIYQLCLKHYVQKFDKNQLAEMTGYSVGSGGFNNAISQLITLGLISRTNGMIHLNPELNEI